MRPSTTRMSGRSTTICLPGHDVVDEVRIDRRRDIAHAGFHVGQEADERRRVIALGKAFALEQPFGDEARVGMEKPVGRYELHLGRVRPARQQGLEHARGRRLADRDRAGDADDVGNLAPVFGAEEALRRLEQPLRRGDVEREQTRQRQIDRNDLFDADRVMKRLQFAQVVYRQRQLGVGAQLRPFLAGEMAIGRGRVASNV